MPVIRVYQLMITISLAAVLSGCSPGDRSTAPVAGPTIPAGGIAGLPGLDELRQTTFARDAQVQIAAQFLSINPANVTDLGLEIEFSPDPEGTPAEQYAWSVHEFVLEDFTGPMTISLEWDEAIEPGLIWLGVANWTAGEWEWVPVEQRTTDLTQQLPSLGQLDIIDPTGNRLCIAAVVGGADARTLRRVSVGEYPWRGWVHSAGGLDDDFIWDIAVDGTGRIAAAGQTWSYGEGLGDCLLYLYNPDGTLAWARAWGTANSEEYTACCFYGDRIYCAGRCDPDGLGFGDILAQGWDLDGNLDFSYHWGGAFEDAAQSIHVDVRGAFICGSTQIYTEDPWRDDADALLLKLNPGLSSVCHAFYWGGEPTWDRAIGTAIPPLFAGDDRYVIVSNEYSDGWFTGEVAPRIAFTYDIGTGPDRSLRLNYGRSAEAAAVCPGANGDILICGQCPVSDPDPRDLGFCTRLDLNAADLGGMLAWAVLIDRDVPLSLEVFGLDVLGDNVVIGGMTGNTGWPGFEIYPYIGIFEYGSGTGAVTGVWNSESTGNDCQDIVIFDNDGNPLVITGGLGVNARGGWYGPGAFNWTGGTCTPAEEDLDYTLATGATGFNLGIAEGLVTDLNELLIEDTGGGMTDPFLTQFALDNILRF